MTLLQELITLERPLIGIDLETNGIVPKTARIVELALEIFRPSSEGITVQEYRTLVNPLEPIPEEATAVHGITDAMVQGCRVCALDKDAHAQLLDHDFQPWPTFHDLAENMFRGLIDCDYAGFHVRFDLAVLAFEFEREKLKLNYENAYLIDGLRLTQVTEPRTLSDVAKAEGIDLLDAHSALADIKASTRVIASKLHRFPHLPRTPRALHLLCYPDWFDVDGKLRWKKGELCLNFGDHREKPLSQIPRGYLTWMLKRDFSDKVKDALRAFLGGTPVQQTA